MDKFVSWVALSLSISLSGFLRAKEGKDLRVPQFFQGLVKTSGLKSLKNRCEGFGRMFGRETEKAGGRKVRWDRRECPCREEIF
jgi:hypothetical protein